MGCIRIYKITVSQFLFLDLPELDMSELLPKEHFGDLSERAAEIQYAAKRTSGQLEKWSMLHLSSYYHSIC